MADAIKDIISNFQNITSEVEDSIKGLSSEALNWNPLPGEANSIYAIISHMCGSEQQWIQHTIGGREVQRDRDAEFTAKGQTVEELLELLEKTQGITSEVLSKETVESLGRTVQRYPDRPKTTALASVVNCLQHVAEHLGHLQLTRQLWEQRK